MRYPAGSDQVGARRVRTQRNEQKGQKPTLVNKVSGKASEGEANPPEALAYNFSHLQTEIAIRCSQQ
jgi:hypothetical protein